MYDNSLASVNAEVEALLVEKFSAKGSNLKEKIEYVGRSLPAKIRAQAGYLIEAETRCQNPKFAHQYEPTRLLSAQKHCVSYLEKIDRSRIRSFRKTAIITTILVNLAVLALAMAVVYNYLPINT